MKAKTDPSELYWIFRQYITNVYTQRIMDRIFSDTQYTSLPADESYITTVRPGEEAFLALLKTPNVVGPVYMLMDYPNGLRRKTVKDIIVKTSPVNWKPRRRDYYLVIELEDAPTRSLLKDAFGGDSKIDTE